MSKKRRRKKMKPYQVKLRVIGVLSLIVSVLVLWMPLPAKAVNSGEPTSWQEEFKDGTGQYYSLDDTNPYYIDLRKFVGTTTTPEYKNDVKTTYTSAGKIKIPKFAVETGSSSYDYYPRIGRHYTGGVFKDQSELTEIDLSNVTFAAATDIHELFSGCSLLETVVFNSSIDTSDVTDMSGMFDDCKKLTTPGTGAFNTAKVTNVSNMFRNNEALTTLDLSNFDLSSVTTEANGKDMLAGCNNLITIKTPKNVDENANIALPNKYMDVKDHSRIYTKLPTKAKAEAGENVSLTLIRAVEEIIVDPGTKALEVGKDFYLTITVSPAVEGNKTVKVESENPAIATVSEASVTAGSNGVATVKVSGIAVGDTNIVATIDGAKNDGTATVLTGQCELKVTEVIVPVEGVAVSSDKNEVDIRSAGETVTMTATLTPPNPTNDGIKWSVSDESLATIDENTGVLSPTGDGVGPVVVTVTTNDGGKTASKTIMIKSSSEFKGIIDSRTDASNKGLTEGGVSGTPLKSDWYLHIDTDESYKSQIDTKLASIGNFEEISYFAISKYDNGVDGSGNKTGNKLSDDFGMATVTMALPGNMLAVPNNMSKLLRLYAYDSGTDSLAQVSCARATVGTNSNIGAVRFTVETADDKLASAYVLAMDPTTTVTPSGALFHVSDDNEHATQDAKSTNPTNQSEDLYLIVDGITEAASTKLKPLVDGDSVLKAYPQKYYYDIYITNQATGGPPLSPITFGSVTITLPLPTGVDWQNGKVWLVSEQNNGSSLDKNEAAKIVQDTETGVVGVQFTATHFSEHAILYDPTASNHTVTTAHTGTGTTAIIPATGITITTTASGDAAASVVPSTNVTVQAEPGTGYHLAGWLKNGILDSGAGTSLVYVFTPTASTTITALFEADSNSGGNASTGGSGTTPVQTYTVKIDTLPSAGGTATADKQTYNSGETATLTAAANDGFAFLYWADAATREPVSSSPAITMTMDGNKHLLAVFAQGEVAGESRTIEANVNVSVPDVNVNVPDVNANVNVSVPDIQVYLNGPGGISAVSGVSSSFIPVRIGNSGDMPKTGIGDMYRIMFAMLLVLSGMVEIMLSIPAKKRRAVHGRNL